MSTFYAQYSSTAQPNPSVGTNGAAIPGDSTLVGGENPSGNLEPLQVDASGALIVSQSGSSTPFATQDAADGTPGAAVPSKAIQVAGSDGTDLRPIATDATGKLNLNNISGTISLPTGASTAANQTSQITQETAIAASTASIDGKTVHVDTGNVTVVSSALPTGASTSALQSSVQSAPGTPQTVAVTVQGNASGVAVPISAASLPIPTGAATASNQTDGSQKTQVVNSADVSVDAKQLGVQVVSTDVGLITNTVIHGLSTAGGGAYVDVKVNPSGTLTVDASGSTGLILGAGTAIIGKVGIDQTTPGTTNQVSAVQNGTWNINNISGTVSLPTGASTAANQTTLGSQTTKINDGTNTAAVKAASTAPVASDPALVVTMSPNAKPPATSGRSLANAPVVTTYGTPITSSAYTTIVASTSAAINLVEIFDSSGVALYFAVGAAASEVNQFIIYPGGNGQVPLSIPAGSRISYKAVSTSASGASAFNVLNMYT